MTESSLEQRFDLAMLELVPDFKKSDAKLGLAVSGGPDSLALLMLAHSVFPARITAASVDHGLRPEASNECGLVASICVDKNIPHSTLTPEKPITGSLQMAARKARYRLLETWMKQGNITWLVTAHHADDQLETLLMRLLRGSGVDGLSGIRRKRGHIIRPLLGMTKQELVDYVASQNITAIADPSNSNVDFDRVRVREALGALSGFDISGANQSAAAMDDASEALQWMTDRLAASHITRTESGATLNSTGLPHELIRRLVLQCLKNCDPDYVPRGRQLEPLIAKLRRGETATIGNILCVGGEIWQFSKAPVRRNG